MLIAFLEYWEKHNYGFMAKCYAPMYDKKPVEIRQEYGNISLINYELIEIIDQMSFMTDIRVKAVVKINDNVEQKYFEFRLTCNTKEGQSAYLPSENTAWGINNRKTY